MGSCAKVWYDLRMTTNEYDLRSNDDLRAAAAHYHEGVRYLPDGEGRQEARQRLHDVMKELKRRGEQIR